MTDAPPDVKQFKEGDIYFWTWKDESRPYAYHCFSRKAIVRRGLLIDTFWSDQTSDRAIDPERVNLDYQGNETTLRRINQWEADYYEPEDVVDMRHSNSSGETVYVQANATRSAGRITAHLEYKRERAQSDIRSAQWSIERIDRALQQVADNQLEGSFP